MVLMPPGTILRSRVLMWPYNGSGNTTQPVGTHSCVDPFISEASGNIFPVVNECNFALRSSHAADLPRSSPVIIPEPTFGNVDADAISAQEPCSPQMVSMATLPSGIAEPTFDIVDADATSAWEPNVLRTLTTVLEKQQINAKPPSAKPKQMSLSHRLAKDVPAVPRVPQTSSKGQVRLRYDFPTKFSDERLHKRQRHCEPAKASAPVSDSRPMLPKPPPAPLPKPPAPPRRRERGQDHNHRRLPEPPPPPRRPLPPPPAPS